MQRQISDKPKEPHEIQLITLSLIPVKRSNIFTTSYFVILIYDFKLSLCFFELKKSVYLFYENVLDTIEGKAELIVKPEEAMRSMKVMEAAFKSSAEGICVKEEI